MKKVMSRSMVTLLVMMVMFCGVVSLAGAELPPVQALKAAHAGLKTFYPQDATMAKPILGLGFRVFTINSAKMIESTGAESFSSMVIPTNTWRFVVLSKGIPAGLLTVTMVNKKWEAVSAGAVELATEIQKVRKSWSKGNGFDFRFIRVYEAVSDFMEISVDKDVLGYIPMPAARMSMQMDQKELDVNTLLYEDEIMEPIRYILKEPKPNFYAEPSVDGN